MSEEVIPFGVKSEPRKVVEAKIVSCQNGYFIQVPDDEGPMPRLWVAKDVEELASIIKQIYAPEAHRAP